MTIEELKNMAKEQKIVLPLLPNRFLEWIRLELREDEELKTFCVAKDGKTEGVLYVTNKRLAFSFMKILAGMNTISLDLDKIDTFTKKSSFTKEEVEIYTASGKVTYIIVGSGANQLEKAINDGKDNLNNNSSKGNTSVSLADELLKFKQLLDMGAITQEEFDNKKKELLGL